MGKMRKKKQNETLLGRFFGNIYTIFVYTLSVWTYSPVNDFFSQVRIARWTGAPKP